MDIKRGGPGFDICLPSCVVYDVYQYLGSASLGRQRDYWEFRCEWAYQPLKPTEELRAGYAAVKKAVKSKL